MARKRKWTAALRRAVDESFFIGLPGLVGCQTVFEKAICIYVNINIYIYNIIFKDRDREYMCDWGNS